MKSLPLSIGCIHFIGIGGIGMSGIAQVLHALGYHVTGSDQARSAGTQRLENDGIQIYIGHKADYVENTALVVISSAVSESNAELARARALMIPVVRRADMLAELMRLKWSIGIAGTHGKTTTTSLVGAMLEVGGLDPTIINGGIINAYSSNALIGKGDWLVAEADESDGTFTRLPATIAVVTNIDPEHMEYYGSFENLRAAFINFITRIPFYGFVVLCTDHGQVQSLIPQIADRRIITCGLSPQADVRGVNLRFDAQGSYFDVEIQNRRDKTTDLIKDFFTPLHGKHNVQNVLAALAVGIEMQIPSEGLRTAMASFKGVHRRFTYVGVGGGIRIIDDYAHHPIEIECVLQAARQIHSAPARVIVLVQPHRYSRLMALYDDFCACFNHADIVVIAPVYAAGEAPIEPFDHHHLARGIRERGHRQVHTIDDPDAVAATIAQVAQPGDTLLCLGAGSITQWAAALPAQLDRAMMTKEGS
ncbi:MAG: UDP-N-acetylmuramate--L-alanine ligase [Pseudomonadota bacterium]